jgi:hypothetical protein
MAPENQFHRYNYQGLDRLLASDYDPKEIGNQLDEIMSDLVSYAAKDDTYSQTLSERHNILRELRNIFWKLNTNHHE